MIQLKYIGKHQPRDMIVEVDNEAEKGLLDTGEWSLLNDNPKVIIPELKKDEEETPTKYWTEGKIKAWIDKNKVNIDYIPERDKKKDVLKKLETGGYL